MEPTQSVIRQCARQTEQLFDLYLNLGTENALKDISDRNKGLQFESGPPGAPPPRRTEEPTEEQLSEIAYTIAELGDQLNEQYINKNWKGKLIEAKLIEFIKEHGSNLAYDTFVAQVNEFIGEDRNVKNFKFVFYLSRRVITSSQTIGSRVTEYFRRYIPEEFAMQMARSYNLVNYFREQR